jgi:hypothetical protein
MSRKIIFLTLLVFLMSAFAISAEGPIGCDIFGYVSYEDGTPVNDGVDVKIDLVGKSVRDDATRGGPPPTFIHGFYGVAFSQMDGCNYGDLVQVEAESGNLKGSSTCHLSELSLRDLCNITLNGGMEELPDIDETDLSEKNIHDCIFSGYVTYNNLEIQDKAQVSINLNGETYTIATYEGPPPDLRKGFYYINLGNSCREKDYVVLSADDGVHYGTKRTTFNVEPSAGQYSISMNKRSSHPEIAESLKEPVIEEPKSDLPVVLLRDETPKGLTSRDMYIFSLLLIILVLAAWILKLNLWDFRRR